MEDEVGRLIGRGEVLTIMTDSSYRSRRTIENCGLWIVDHRSHVNVQMCRCAEVGSAVCLVGTQATGDGCRAKQSARKAPTSSPPWCVRRVSQTLEVVGCLSV